MAKIWVDPKEMTRGRFAGLREHVNCSVATLVGVLGLFWAETREHAIEAATADELMRMLAVEPALRALYLGGMLKVGYLAAESSSELISISDNAGIGAKKALYKANGAKGAAVRDAPKPVRKKRVARAGVQLVPGQEGALVPIGTDAKKEANRATWASYAQAYLARMGQPPARNAKSNALISQFVDRLGVDEAPQVIAFFVSHPNAYFMERLYMLDLAVKNAESLRTQWANNRPITRAEVESYSHTRVREQEQADVMRMRAEVRR